MEGLGARLKRELSSSICKLFPKTPSCDSSNSGGSGGNNNNNNDNDGGIDDDGGYGGGNNKQTTSTPTKAAAPATTPTTSSSTKQSTPTSTTQMRYVAATTSAATTPSTTTAAQVAQSSPSAAASSPSTSTTQQQQQQSAASSTTSPQADASQAPTTAAATSAGPVSSASSQDQPATGTAVAPTTTAAAGYGASASRSEIGSLLTPSPDVAAATGTVRISHPTSSSTVAGSDGGKSDQASGTTTTKTPAIAGAIVGVIVLLVLAALLYRYRRSRVVRPVLLPFSCAKRRKRNGSAASSEAQMRPHHPTDEKSSRENLLSPGVSGGVAPRPASPNSNTEPYSAAGSYQRAALPLTKPPLTLQQRRASRGGIRRVAIPRDQRIVPLGQQPSDPLSPGFPIPPSPTLASRHSVSSLSSMRTTGPETTRPYSRATSVASSGVLCPVVMAWPMPPTSMPISPLSGGASSSGGTWETAREGGTGEWPRHVAMYHDDTKGER